MSPHNSVGIIAAVISLLTLYNNAAIGFSPSPSHNTHHGYQIATSFITTLLATRDTRNHNPRKQREDQSIRYYNDDDDYDDESLSMIQHERKTSSIDCPHFGTCPGCVVDTNIANIDVVESAKLYFSSSSIQKHIIQTKHGRGYNNYNNYYDDDEDDDDEFYQIRIPSDITSWRTQAKLAVQSSSTWSRSAGCTIGLYQRASHDVLSIPDCRVHHPAINHAVALITQATQTVRTPAYQEDTGEGLLRYIQLQVETSTNKVCLSLVMNAESYKQTQPHLSYLVKELKKLDVDKKIWHSIWCHCNDSSGNAIFVRDVTRWHPVDGPPYIREGIPGSDPNKREGLLYFAPYVFRQGNLHGFHDIAQEVWEAIPQQSKVCELYAGVGLLGLSALLHHGKEKEMEEEGEEEGGSSGLQWLRCSDENPENARCFERAVNSMPMHITGRAPRKFNKDGKGKGRNNAKGRRGRNNRGGKKKGQDGEMLSIKDLMDNMMVEGKSGGQQRGSSSETDPSDRVTYMQANAVAALYRGQALGANVLIVDPPRKGLDDGVVQQLTQRYNPNQMYTESPTLISHLPRHSVNWTNDVRTLIYVSCGFDALARDLDTLLTSSAGWKLESATGYVLFPGSNHVETVVVLRR